MSWLERIGARTTRFIEEMGRASIMLLSAVRSAFVPPFGLRLLLRQMEVIGVNSIPVVMVTATFTGMVLALQSYIGFKRFSAENLVGSVVALSMTRELGPVLTGLMVAGRAGAAMAAELGTMKVTEQIDALVTMAVNPVKHLVTPRLIAGFIMLPVLTILADMIGITGGYFVSVKVLDANPTVYIKRTTEFLDLEDVYGGLLKAAVFGTLIAMASCYRGFQAEGGAEGVGKATTGAVVTACLLILISNYFVTAILF
jgi:phospholipid/cholesterol/gamma-HCH transport system permease protein